MEKRNILEEADFIINKRESSYGTKEECFGKISIIATLLTGKALTESDCCKVLMAVKIIRESFVPKHDNRVDLIGYTAILDQLIEDK